MTDENQDTGDHAVSLRVGLAGVHRQWGRRGPAPALVAGEELYGQDGTVNGCAKPLTRAPGGGPAWTITLHPRPLHTAFQGDLERAWEVHWPSLSGLSPCPFPASTGTKGI